MTGVPICRNQYNDLLSKSMDWFLYDSGSVIEELSSKICGTVFFFLCFFLLGNVSKANVIFLF